MGQPSLFFYEGDRVQVRGGFDQPKGTVIEVNDDEGHVVVQFDGLPWPQPVSANRIRKISVENGDG